jgi:hypothetical protein
MEAFMEAIPAWVTAFTLVLTAATAITALTPSSADNQILNVILKALNMAAGNVGKNKNADDK